MTRKVTIPASLARAAGIIGSDNAAGGKYDALRRIEIADGQIRAFSHDFSVVMRVDDMPDEGEEALHVDAAALLEAAKSTGKKHPIVMLEVDEIAEDAHAELRDSDEAKPRTKITYRGKGKNPITVSADHDELGALPLAKLQDWIGDIPVNGMIWTSMTDVRIKKLHDFVKAAGVALVQLGIPVQLAGDRLALCAPGDATDPAKELPLVIQARGNADGSPFVVEGFIAPNDLTVPTMELGIVKQTEEVPWTPISDKELEALLAESGASETPQTEGDSSPVSEESTPTLSPEIVELASQVSLDQLETAVAIALACDQHAELLPLIIQAVEEMETD